MRVGSILTVRERFRLERPKDKCYEFLLVLESDNTALWLPQSKYPLDDSSLSKLRAFLRKNAKQVAPGTYAAIVNRNVQKPKRKLQHKDQSNSKKACINAEVLKTVDGNRLKESSVIDLTEDELPKKVKVTESFDMTDLLKEPETDASTIPPGHTLPQSLNSEEIYHRGKIGQTVDPFGSLIPDSYEMIHAPYGYRVVKKNARKFAEFDIQFLAQLKDKYGRYFKKWLSAYGFDQDSRTHLASRNLHRFHSSVFGRVLEILPCRDTFVVCADTLDGTIWIDEFQLKRLYINNAKTPEQRVNKRAFQSFLEKNPQVDAIFRYVRSKQGVSPQNLQISKTIYKYQLEPDEADVVFEEGQFMAYNRMKGVLDNFFVEDMYDSQFGFGKRSDPEVVSNEPAKRPSHDYTTKSMQNIVFSTNNEEYKLKEKRKIEKKIDDKNKLMYQVTRKFDDSERTYRENIAMWERSGQWEIKRQARYAKDEARKRMTKVGKEIDALYNKNGPHHYVINFNSSEAQKQNDDTNFMFETLELPYKLPRDITKKEMRRKVCMNALNMPKFHFAHDVFTFLNQRNRARERQMYQRPIASSLLHTKPQFRGIAPKQKAPRARRTKPRVVPQPPKIPPTNFVADKHRSNSSKRPLESLHRESTEVNPRSSKIRKIERPTDPRRAAARPKKVLTLEQYKERNTKCKLPSNQTSLSAVIDLLSDDEPKKENLIDEDSMPASRFLSQVSEVVDFDPGATKIHHKERQVGSKAPEVPDSPPEDVFQNIEPDIIQSTTQDRSLTIALYQKRFRQICANTDILRFDTETRTRPEAPSRFKKVHLSFTDILKQSSFSTLRKHTEEWVPKVLTRTPQTQSETILALNWTSKDELDYCEDNSCPLDSFENSPTEAHPSQPETSDTSDCSDDFMSPSQQPVSRCDNAAGNECNQKWKVIDGKFLVPAATIGPVMPPPEVPYSSNLISSGESLKAIDFKNAAISHAQSIELIRTKLQLSGNDVPQTPKRPQTSNWIPFGSEFIKTLAQNTTLPDRVSCTDMDTT